MYANKFLLPALILAVLLINLLPAGAETVQEWLNKGLKLYEEGEYEEAITCYDRAIETGSEQ